MLDAGENNIQKTWKIINQIIRNGSKQSELPNFFLNSCGSKVENLKAIVDDFNDYFINVGPSLASKIIVDDNNKDQFNSLINSNLNSMFLSRVEEKDIIHVVQKCSSKTSTVINDRDMGIIKLLVQL